MAIFCLGVLSSSAFALDASDFSDLIGFTVVAASRLKGDYFGAEPGKPIVLENGMSFRFSVPFSNYSYRPRAVVFARVEDAAGRRGDSAADYKVLVQDRLYGARRIE